MERGRARWGARALVLCLSQCGPGSTVPPGGKCHVCADRTLLNNETKPNETSHETKLCGPDKVGKEIKTIQKPSAWHPSEDAGGLGF